MKERQRVTLLPGVEAKLVEKLFGQVVPEEYMARENPRTIIHRHSYGGLTHFFEMLLQGELWGPKCTNPQCKTDGKSIWLPPRVHCPDCWDEMMWVPINTDKAKVYTHSTTHLPGAGFMATVPCPLISIEIPRVCTKFMSYLSEFGEGEPYIGMPVKPVFRTREPTYTILDISWVPAE